MNGIHVFLAAIRLRAVRRFSVLVARSLVLLALAAAAAYSQQQFIQTVTAQNKNCNTTCSVIDIPELNGNPVAVIFITPIVNNGFNINPHPIGAYYMYLKKWSVFNLDGVTIPDGAKFKIEYYTHPDANAFVYTVPRQVHLSDIPYIDREGLNDNPNATVRLFPTSSPSHGALYNKDDVKALYDETARKWYVVNLNNKPVPWESVYNVEITIGGVANVAPQSPVKTVNDKNIFVPPRVPPPILTTTEPNVAAPVQSTAPKAGTPLQSTKVPIKAPLNRPNTERWILRADEQPAIPPNSDILLFIHGMDSRAEEADDITNALFALKANPSAAAAPTPSNAQMVADLNRILHKYEGCILEKYETQQDMADRGLSATLSGLANTNACRTETALRALLAIYVRVPRDKQVLMHCKPRRIMEMRRILRRT